MAFVDRTQEVGGSNPPSSIARSPCTAGASLFQGISNRPLKMRSAAKGLAAIAVDSGLHLGSSRADGE
jgi:hypothetical protein